MYVYEIWKAKWKCNKFSMMEIDVKLIQYFFHKVIYICWCYCKMLLTKLKIPSHNFFCSFIHFYLSIYTAVGLTLCRHRTVAMDKYKWRHVFVKYILEIYVNYHCSGILNVCKKHCKNRWKPRYFFLFHFSLLFSRLKNHLKLFQT
jgi:hypothetical protein